MTSLIFIAPALSTFCCQTSSGSDVFQCYSSGYCCRIGVEENGVLVEYWYSTGCFDFETWVEPNRMMFTVGRSTPINLYVHNLENYTDKYNISYNITSTNPELISVDLRGVTPTDSVGPGEIEKLYPRIIVLARYASGTIFFNVTSWGSNQMQRNASLIIQTSDVPISLKEFDSNLLLWFLIVMIICLFYLKSRIH